jgi:hypothetical protein
MVNKRGRGSTPGHESKGGLVDGGAEQVVERLGRSFAEFRRTHRSRARIPQTLRDATLAAIQQGTPEQEVMRACRITQAQLDRWRECQGARMQTIGPNETGPLVFPVVEDGLCAGRVAGGSEGEAVPLQLRVGRWEISIRPLDW